MGSVLESDDSDGESTSPTNATEIGDHREDSQESSSFSHHFHGKNYETRDDGVTRRIKRSKMGIENLPKTTDPKLVEAKRRKKLIRKQFIELSSILPGPKKVKKACILEDAAKYMKELQERAVILEEKLNKRSRSETMAFSDERVGSCDDNSYSRYMESLPEIEAKAEQKTALIKIHCKKEKCYLAKILEEIEKLHLTIVNVSALPFADYFLDVTISAQMDDEFCMTTKDLTRNLRQALQTSCANKHKNRCLQ